MVEVITADGIDNRGQRRHYVRVRLESTNGGPPLARIAGEQGAGVLSSLAAADALMVVPEELERVQPGTRLASDSARPSKSAPPGPVPAKPLDFCRAIARCSPRRIVRLRDSGGSMVQRFGALDSMRTMLGVLREVSLDDIREQAESAPRLFIVGPTADEARRLGLAVTGPEGQFATIISRCRRTHRVGWTRGRGRRLGS